MLPGVGSRLLPTQAEKQQETDLTVAHPLTPTVRGRGGLCVASRPQKARLGRLCGPPAATTEPPLGATCTEVSTALPRLGSQKQRGGAVCGSRALAPCVARGDRASQVFRAVGRAGVLAAEGAPSAALPTPPTCFSTFPRRPIMLGSSGSSASAGPLVRSLSVMAGPRPTIWSTLPGREPPSMSSGDSGAARGPLHLGQATAPQGQPTGGAAGCQDRWAPGARFSRCSPHPGPPLPMPSQRAGT